ncbi:MAG: 16S rRNA (guanine(966)-N(2))-methyltransferase RsmD [Gammaproteobacteria bacterium]|nr:16S rRNA (guanine(966)-N(2))-methyltransferase RsmD [Gammaproteobacteria bacterium]
MPRAQYSTIRIIGGEWRGRKVIFRTLPTLRPTPDRVRETLFNWLSPVIAGSACLDLFAGSGILGLEALSRGAHHVSFVEQEKLTALSIREHLKKFRAEQKGTVFWEESLEWLKKTSEKFDIVFCDPPFQSLLSKDFQIVSCFQQLQISSHLNPNALIYIESPKRLKDLPLPPDWQVYRDKTAGDVRYMLYQV